jgi:hypothetical protein
MSLYEKLILKENLVYAWKKAKKMYSFADGYVDRAELAKFELNLESELLEINNKFKSGTYKCLPLRPLPRPKKLENESEVNRQYYHVSVRDQVAWIAVINAIGPDLDQQMPPWSYGNRLYRPAWYEEVDGVRSRLEVGPYRHASGHLYKKFQHSWPLFRRHIALTARNMVSPISVEDVTDSSELSALIIGYKEKLPYLVKGFWGGRNAANNKKLFYASIDIKQFFPNISAGSILSSLSSCLAGFEEDVKFKKLIKNMLVFNLSDDYFSEEILFSTVPEFKKGKIDGIPTGLFVSGFLSNIALLPIDKAVHAKVSKNKNLAHFRFVDDHTFISYEFDVLFEWIGFYKDILAKFNASLVINEEKFDPISLSDLMKDKDNSQYRSVAIKECEIDGRNPTKLLTKTLGQVSAIANVGIEILDDVELDARLSQLEWLLLADIPDREIRSDTRAAFAAGQIASLAFLLLQESDCAVLDLQNVLVVSENKRIKACFSMLMRAFTENPCKARLFYRLIDYCYLTGFQGLPEIGRWCRDERDSGRDYWANYYTSILLNILSVTLLRSIRCLSSNTSLWAARHAAIAHIDDISNLKWEYFFIEPEEETWFSEKAKSEFSVALLSSIYFLELHKADPSLIKKISRLKSVYSYDSFDLKYKNWKGGVGVWAYWVENIVKSNENPSILWPLFEAGFDYLSKNDLSAARFYPEKISNFGLEVIIKSNTFFGKYDAALVKEIIGSNQYRIEMAKNSKNIAFNIAVKNLIDTDFVNVTLNSWISFVKKLDYFDPRRGEWTCLLIVKLILQKMLEIESKMELVDLHPENILLPKCWAEDRGNSELAFFGWESWRRFTDKNNKIHCIKRKMSIYDYRYSQNQLKLVGGELMNAKLRAVGLILLGLLRETFAIPKAYNIRGLESTVDFPTSSLISHMAISSPTLEILRGCLTSRSNENRSINQQPDFYGMQEGDLPNDTQYDPPIINNINSLLHKVESAQRTLENNQVSVSMHQPRQLIPVKISELVVFVDSNEEG